jgi:hypothetical protein
MKKILVFVSLLATLLEAAGQNEIEFVGKFHNKKNAACDARVELADSSINCQYNSVDNTYLPVSVIQYFYNENWNVNIVIKKTLPERTNIYRQIFEYNNDQNIVKYIYQIWTENGWRDNLINERTYTSEGLIDTEVFIRENAQSVFVPYQRHFYSSEEGRITGYIRQVRDASGNWYNFSSHHYVYDESGRLAILYGKYFNSDLVYWERTSVYGEDGHIAERFLKILKYDSSVKMNVLTNSTLQKYHYNIYGNADTIFNFNWSGSAWVYVSKDINYFSLIKGKKVRICHNGVNICISSNAVRTHLEHGDTLGECKPEEENATMPDDKSFKLGIPGFSIYPNPARNYVTLKIEGDAGRYCNAMILSADGKVLVAADIGGKNEFTIDLSGLTNGTYYLMIQKKEGFDTRAFIKN